MLTLQRQNFPDGKITEPGGAPVSSSKALRYIFEDIKREYCIPQPVTALISELVTNKIQRLLQNVGTF